MYILYIRDGAEISKRLAKLERTCCSNNAQDPYNATPVAMHEEYSRVDGSGHRRDAWRIAILPDIGGVVERDDRPAREYGLVV